MERPATWKVITVGAALTGLGILGAGTATAATAPAPAAIGIEAQQFGWAPELGDINLDQPAGGFEALDDDWTETYWDHNWVNNNWHDNWTETYWDD